MATLLAVAAAVNVAPATAGAGNPVKVIVNFHQPVGAASLAAVEQAGGNVRHRYRLIAAVSATLPQQAIGALGRHPLVESVELDHEVALFHHGPSTGNPELEAAWGVEHIGAGQVHQAGNTGSGVKVGVIDTGVDYTHPDLDSVYAGGWDFFNNDPDPFDDQGHGTHVSGSIAAELNVPPAGVVGVAPSARLYAYKVLGADGRGDYSGVIAALEQAALVDRVDVVNMSLGGREVSTALENAVAAAYAAGVILVAAAGNVNPANFFELLFGCPVAYPAKYPQVFATTFTGQNNELTGYSCTGPEVDFAAPGDQVNSTVPTGSCPFCAPSGYRSLSGTSMASPHLAGTVALVLAHGIANTGDPATRADDVKAHLCATTMPGFGVLTTPIPETDPRYAQYFGCGVVDARNALLDNPPGSGGGGGGSDDPDPTPTPTPTPSPTPTSTPSPTSQPSPEPPPQTIHVADLSGSATRQGNGWTARVTILVHDTEHTALSGVTVSGSWSTGAVGSCRSNGSGLCTISLSKLPTSLAGVTLSVTDLVRSGWTYAAADNHDADGDSDGTTIEVLRP